MVARSLAAQLAEGRHPATWTAYVAALHQGFQGATPAELARRWQHMGQPQILSEWRAAVDRWNEAGTGAASQRLRLAAARAVLVRLVELGQRHAPIPRAPTIAAPPPRRYALDRWAIARMLAVAGDDAIGLRDQAIVRVAFDLSLRAAEIAGLPLDAYDRAGQTISVRRKGATGPETRTLPVETDEALSAWLDARPLACAPSLFVQLDTIRGEYGQPIGARGVRARIATLGRRAIGRPVSPNALRHASITAAAELTHGNAYRVQRFAGHRRLATAQAYVEISDDDAGRVAGMVAASVPSPRSARKISSAALASLPASAGETAGDAGAAARSPAPSR